MVGESSSIPGGWPLGLERMIGRLQATEALRGSANASPDSYNMRSDSFPSYSSSSGLDTESSRSFFLDSRTSLGRLIGISAGDGELYFTNPVLHEEPETMPMLNASSDATEIRDTRISCCLCVPSIANILTSGSTRRARDHANGECIIRRY